jgi:uncharacterized protein
LNPFTSTPLPDLKKLFDDLNTVAVVGSSSNPYRTSYHIAEYIIQAGIEMIPVNPNETEVLGRKSYPSLDDIPREIKIDLIDIFRNKRYSLETVKEIIEWSEKTGQKPIIWTQLDVSTDAAKELAEENGFTYVENRCFMVEHRR